MTDCLGVRRDRPSNGLVHSPYAERVEHADTRSAGLPRRVLFVESGPGNGGSAFSLLRLVNSLDRARYQPHVVVFHDAAAFEQIRSLGVPVETIRLLRPFSEPLPEDRPLWTKARNYCSFYGNLGADTLYNGIRVARYVRRQSIDLVHLNNGILENLSGAFAARLTRIPCVSHVRGTERFMKIEKYCAAWLAAVVTLNRTMRDDYIPVLGEEKVHIIFNGVDLDATRNANPQRIREEFKILPGTLAVGTFARLVEGKGIPEFIATASKVSKEHARSRFFIIGDESTKDGVFESRMRKCAEDLGVGPRLVFTGWRGDRFDIMAAMDVVLQISTTFPEGMSLAPLEAMALGKPVIVTDIPGYEFSVDDGRTGFVVAPGDIEALAERVLMLARDRDLACRIGRAGYEKAIREFDIRRTARRVEELYDQVLKRNEAGWRSHGVAACEEQP
ncbi:MAG: glycosyltransferase family 4 protein [Candidatus Binatia bacterium]